MAFQKIILKCIKCGNEESEIIPTEYGTGAMCTKCYNVVKLNDISTNINKPKCPTCNSTNIQKISGTKRFVATGLFGLASSNIGKTMECKNCGAKW